MFRRLVEPHLREALGDTPVVVIAGPRRSGKSTFVTPADFADLRKLAGACGPKFACGVVLHDGDAIVPFGARQVAAPLSCLWAGPTSPGRHRRASRES